MKKILIVILVLCFIFIISCKNEEIPNLNEDKENVELNNAEPNKDESFTLNNVKYLTVRFPENIFKDNTIQLNLVSSDKFVWGDYIPFSRTKQSVYASDRNRYYFYDYGIFTSSAKSITEANYVYEKLRSKYQTKNSSNGFDISLFKIDSESIKNELSNHLCENKVIYISEEADKIGNLYIKNDSNFLLCNYVYELHSEYDVKSIEATTPLKDACGYINHNNDYTFPEKTLPKNLSGFVVVACQNDDVIVTRKDDVEQSATLYRLHTNDGELFCEVKVPYNKTNFVTLEQIVEDRYLLFSVTENDQEQAENALNYKTATYLYDIVSEKMTYLESNTYMPSISPDLKYLAYTDNFQNTESTIAEGFYIKNLNDGTTVFYEHADSGLYGVISWVNEEKLLELLS